MRPLELRHEIAKKLASLDEVERVNLLSPMPGYPVHLRVHTIDPSGDPRTYTVSISED